MSSRHDKDHPFEISLPAHTASDWNGPSAGPDARALHELHHASQTLLQLATHTHAAVARSDAAAAQAARASLEAQLSVTTRMFDELLFGASDRTTH